MTQRFEWLNIPKGEPDIKKRLKETIHEHLRRTLAFPDFGELKAQLSDLSGQDILDGMNALTRNQFLVFNEDENWYRLASKDEKRMVLPTEDFNLTEILKAEEKPAPPIIKRTTKPVPVRKPKVKEEGVYGVPIYIIQFLMAIIGIGAAVISVYYTTIWLLEFLPWAFALLLSSIMVGFSVSAFETVILFMSGQVTESRTAKATIAGGFIILWIIVSFFSIASTVAGQYNRHVQNLREEAKAGVSTGRQNWAILQEQKGELQKRLSEYREQVSTLNKIMAGMSDVESRTRNNQVWYETQFRLQKANEQMSKVALDLDKVRDEERVRLEESRKTGIVLSTTSAKDIPDFYAWLSNVTGAERDKAQFVMALFPAVFCDIMAPVALAVALFLRRKKR
jgi:hypothetical protein